MKINMVVKTKLHSQIVVIIFVFLLCQSCNENSATNGQKGIVKNDAARKTNSGQDKARNPHPKRIHVGKKPHGHTRQGTHKRKKT